MSAIADALRMDAHEALGGFANYSAEQLAQLCHVSVRTARRWRRNGVAPTLALRWLRLIKYGVLELIHPHWAGWHVRDGELHHPNGWTFTPDELTAIPLRYQEASAMRAQLQKQRAAITAAPVTINVTMHLPAFTLGLHDLAALRQPIAFLQSTCASTASHDQRVPLGNRYMRYVALARSSVPPDSF